MWNHYSVIRKDSHAWNRQNKAKMENIVQASCRICVTVFKFCFVALNDVLNLLNNWFRTKIHTFRSANQQKSVSPAYRLTVWTKNNSKGTMENRRRENVSMKRKKWNAKLSTRYMSQNIERFISDVEEMISQQWAAERKSKPVRGLFLTFCWHAEKNCLNLNFTSLTDSKLSILWTFLIFFQSLLTRRTVHVVSFQFC